MSDEPQKTNRPPGDPFRQQKLSAWQPIMTPLKVVIVFIAIGVTFIPSGVSLLGTSSDIYKDEIQYDGPNQKVDCSINNQNQNRKCTMRFDITKDVDGPLYVYYQLSNYFQNHRRYVDSIDPYQLQGQRVSRNTLKDTCVTKYENGSLTLNPCGLIANSFFTDLISLDTSSSMPNNLVLDESDIAWEADDKKFKQPDGFQACELQDGLTPSDVSCANACKLQGDSSGLPESCQDYTDPTTNKAYKFYYPDADTTQYLYQSYPDQISPIDGVLNEHFQVWMRAAALPKFRKLYGKIEGDFKAGDYLIFNVTANYEVNSFDGTKSLTISTLGAFGGENPYLGLSYIVVGAISLMFGLLIVTKQVVAPRKVADPSLLSWTT